MKGNKVRLVKKQTGRIYGEVPTAGSCSPGAFTRACVWGAQVPWGKGQSCPHWAGPQQAPQMQAVGKKGRAHARCHCPLSSLCALGLRRLKTGCGHRSASMPLPCMLEMPAGLQGSGECWQATPRGAWSLLAPAPLQIFRLRRKNAAPKHQNHARCQYQSFI